MRWDSQVAILPDDNSDDNAANRSQTKTSTNSGRKTNITTNKLNGKSRLLPPCIIAHRFPAVRSPGFGKGVAENPAEQRFSRGGMLHSETVENFIGALAVSR